MPGFLIRHSTSRNASRLYSISRVINFPGGNRRIYVRPVRRTGGSHLRPCARTSVVREDFFRAPDVHRARDRRKKKTRRQIRGNRRASNDTPGHDAEERLPREIHEDSYNLPPSRRNFFKSHSQIRATRASGTHCISIPYACSCRRGHAAGGWSLDIQMPRGTRISANSSSLSAVTCANIIYKIEAIIVRVRWETRKGNLVPGMKTLKPRSQSNCSFTFVTNVECLELLSLC